MRSSLAATLVALGATLAVVESVLAAPSLPCDVGLFKSTAGTCVSSCPSSSFGDAKTGTCKSCYSTSYKSCTSARVGAATACVQGYYLKAGRCMAEANIPAGSYGTADGKVVNCGDGVQKCSAAGIESCKANYTLSNGKCVACPAGSSACSSPTTATACTTGFFLSNGQCIKNCPASTFANTATAKCQPCFAPSYTSCTNARSSSATACATGYYLTGGRCMPASAIPKGKYGGSDGKLHACPTGQATCTEAGPTTCKTGYTLSADKTKCEEKPACPAHSVCDAVGTVTSCTDSFRLLNGTCAPPCVDGTYPYWRDGSCKATCPTDSWLLNGECAQCDPHAVSCGLWQYMQCEPGWTRVGFDYEQTCWKKCPDGQRPTDRSENAVCVPCSDPNAENCFADDSSLYCKPGFLISYDRAQKFRRCVDKCGDQQYDSGAGPDGTCLYCPDLNASSCEGRSGYPTKCKDGYRVSGDGHSCIVDDGTCISAGQCDASGKLTACGQDWYLLGNECLRSCPLDKVTNHPFNSNTLLGGECIDKCPIDKYQGPNRDNVPGEYCYECGDNVAECGSNGYPSVCKEGYTLWTRSYGATACAYTCPAGTKAQYGTETCVPCSGPGAATCNNYDEALSCLPGYTLVDTTCQAN